MKNLSSFFVFVAVGLLFLGASFPVMSDEWKFERDGVQIEVDTARSGQLVHWSVGGKVLVDAKQASSPLQIELAGSKRASFVAEKVLEKKSDEVSIRGNLTADRQLFPAIIRYRIEENGWQLRVAVQLEKNSAQSAVRELSWSLPLALEPRKRVWFCGDYELEWDTRYFYQFMAGTTSNPLAYPDRNEWRYFGLDQLGKDAFRLWKAESIETSPLQMQEGNRAVPAVQIYDESGGVTLEYPALADGKGRSLRVDAANGAEAKVLFWSRNVPPATPEQTEAFGAMHQITLSAQSSEEAALQKQKELKNQHSSTPRPTTEEALKEEEWVRTTPQESSLQYVTGGYPFAPGELRDVQKLRVAVKGKTVPLQARATAFWPDKTLKWVLLTFPIDPAQGVEQASAPRVSLRNGKFLPVSITHTQKSAAPTSPVSLSVQQKEDGSISIVNDRWSLEVGKGAEWLRELEYQGKNLLQQGAGARQAYSDYLRDPIKVLPYEREAVGGEPDKGTLRIEKVEIEEQGPLRAVLRLEGLTDNAEATRIILRLEVLAGRPELRLTHTAEFRFKDPRKTFLTGLGLELPIGAEEAGQADETTLTLQLSRDHQETRVQKSGEWQFASQGSDSKDRNSGWAQLRNEKLKITGVTRNFRETAPKGVAVNSHDGTLRFELWPTEAGPMDVRRYSNYPHRSQGESVRDQEGWVEDAYYPEDPFVGITRTHELLVSFQPEEGAVSAETLAADFQSPPLLYAGWDQYQNSKVVLPAPSQEEWPKAWQSWTNLANFWLWHRKLHRWYGFWHYGDIRHLFQNGYGVVIAPEVLAEKKPWKTPQEKLPPGTTRRDYHPPNDWAYDNGRWGWGNTEGLPNLFLQQEYLRHGNRAVYFAAEALGRHGRDVVTRHEGKWFGKGTRHGVQHWSDGNHEERQTTITEYRLHYFLSGDGRSHDTIKKLYDGIYSQTPVTIHAAHSGRLGGLLFHWEISGADEEAEQLKRYVDLFLSPEGVYISPQVGFPGPEATASPRDLNSSNMFFHHFGGMHALIEYQQITGDQKLAEALIKMAEHALNSPEVLQRYNRGRDGGYWAVIAFAASNAPDPAPYRKLFHDFAEAGGWKYLYQPVTQKSEHWSGSSAYMISSVPGTWFWAGWAPYITQSIGPKEIWNEKIEADFDEIEKVGNPAPRPRPSWQSEYDGIPELEEFLGSQQPWKNKE